MWIVSPSVERERLAQHGQRLVALAPQVHLDPLAVVVQADVVGPGVQVGVAVELAVDPAEHVRG